MKDLKLSIEINKPAKEIFDFTINPKNTPKWVSFISEEVTNEWPVKLGTVYRNRGNPNSEWSEFELTEFEPYKVFTLSQKNDSYHVRYTFTPITPDSTMLDYYEWTGANELDVPFTMEPLQKLKQILETEQR